MKTTKEERTITHETSTKKPGRVTRYFKYKCIKEL